jgi:hypothetical protein
MEFLVFFVWKLLISKSAKIYPTWHISPMKEISLTTQTREFDCAASCFNLFGLNLPELLVTDWLGETNRAFCLIVVCHMNDVAD